MGANSAPPFPYKIGVGLRYVSKNLDATAVVPNYRLCGYIPDRNKYL